MAQQHPKFPEDTLAIRRHIHALVALEADAADSRIHAMHNAMVAKNGWREQSAQQRALWEAHWALRCKADDQYCFARSAGQLPFAFHGTTVFQTQGGAA